MVFFLQKTKALGVSDGFKQPFLQFFPAGVLREQKHIKTSVRGGKPEMETRQRTGEKTIQLFYVSTTTNNATQEVTNLPTLGIVLIYKTLAVHNEHALYSLKPIELK